MRLLITMMMTEHEHVSVSPPLSKFVCARNQSHGIFQSIPMPVCGNSHIKKGKFFDAPS